MSECKWREANHRSECGVIVGCDRQQEWMLPWWWENYSKHNAFPVTFVDFGLSDSMLVWCKKQGELQILPAQSYAATKGSVDRKKGDFWESIYEGKSWWDKRERWHQKPLAMLQTPYKYTLWLDVDCEVLSSLHELFIQLKDSRGLLMAQEIHGLQAFDRDRGHIFPGEILYNSGVVGYQKYAIEILKWAERTEVEHQHHFSDQNLLSRLIFEQGWAVNELDPLYNWRILTHGPCSKARIVHWTGEGGKFLISLKIQQEIQTKFL